MASNPIAIFAMIAVAALVLFLSAYQFRRSGSRRMAAMIVAGGVIILVAMAWLWPAAPIIDRSIDEGVPMVDAQGPIATRDVSPARPTDLTTAEYLQRAFAADQFEIRSGDMAAARGENSSVRLFGEQMAKEHRITSNQLKQAIDQAGLSDVPEPSLSAEQKAMIVELQGSSPERFDAVYKAQQVAAHEDALKLNRAYAAHGDNEVLRGLASAFATKIGVHLQKARSLDEGL